MKILLIVPMVLLLGGCQSAPVRQFMEGFTSEGKEQLKSIAGEVVESKIGEAIDRKLGPNVSAEFKKAIEGIPKPEKPEPADPTKTTGLATLGALVAYIIGSYGKGVIRDKLNKGKE
jgi:hypothetical protein